MYGIGKESEMKSAVHSSKDSRIDLRVNSSQKSLLEQAAASQGKKLSEFVISAASEAAAAALADQNRFLLPEAQMIQFLELLDEDTAPPASLKDLFARKSVFE